MLKLQLISVVILLAAFLSYLNAQSCKHRTERELKIKLKIFGSYNKRYQAITKEDADKFPSLLDQTSTAKTPGEYNRMKRLFRSKGKAIEYPQINLTTVAHPGSPDHNGLLHLCTEWSAVTTLSEDYFPRYLNEVVCDIDDSGCFSYQGLCVQGSLFVNALMKTGVCAADGKEEWEVVSQPVKSYCICRLFPGSAVSAYLP